MRILLLCHSFNSLSQRIFVELRERGHELSVELDINDAVSIEAVELFRPDVVVAPFLKRAIPEAIWSRVACLVVHPGPPGDGGPTALDWAILDGEPTWAVTVLRATGELDGGPVLAWRSFPMRRATKSSLYRNEVTEAAVAAVLEAVAGLTDSRGGDRPIAGGVAASKRWRDAVQQRDRAIDWSVDDTEAVLRKIASADGAPGVRDRMFGREVYLYDAAALDFGGVTARPGEPVARCGGAIARATRDGAVWIGHVRIANALRGLKRPAAEIFADDAAHLPVIEGPRDVHYSEEGQVGVLHFAFHNGAMSTARCQSLLAAFAAATARPTRVIVLMGGPEFWSNGLDLVAIETSASPADASWANINAIDDLAEAIVRATGHYVIAALNGNAGAGGVFLARAADEVWVRRGVILNPHYKDMGNLYGSELWTYLLPRHVGRENAKCIMDSRLPMGAREALRLGLADREIDASRTDFADEAGCRALAIAASMDLSERLDRKRSRRAADEAHRPLASYRSDELAHMHRNFYGFDPSYHIARFNFVHKVPKSRTPPTLARHRDRNCGRRSDVREVSP